MPLGIIDNRDAVAGALFLAAGLAGGALATAYPLGSAMRMGPGYFPLLLGIALAVLGAVLLLRSLRLGAGRETLRGSLSWRPAAFVGAGVIAFALLAQEQGLLLATLTLTLLSGLARRGARLAELLGLGAALSAFGVAVFSFGLGLPLPILPR